MFKSISVIVLFLLSVCLGIVSCSTDQDEVYALPADVHLNHYQQFDPILTDYLLESPLKHPFIWNDSIVSLCRMKKIEIVRKGNKKPDDVAERFEFLFDLAGRPTSFYFYNYELSKSIYSEVKFRYNGNSLELLSPIFLGKNSDQSVNIKESDTLTLMVRKKKGNTGDSTFIFTSNGKQLARIEKLGTFVSRVQFYLPSNKPISSLKSILKRSGIKSEEFLLAEKTVTFTENYIPQRSYYLNENFIKGDLTEEWFYGNFGELSAYKKYINNTCVKDMKFNYSKDKVLRSVENNRLIYEVNYQ
jgi:hypothetical protein